MSIELKVNEMIREGKSVEEIVATNISTPSYVKRCFTKLGVDYKPAEQKDATISKTETVQKEDFFEAKMNEMESEIINEKAKQLSQAFKMVIENPQAFLLALDSMTGKENNSKVVVRVSKCHRHPDVDVKPGSNCHECIKSCQEEQHRMLLTTYVIPCPKCNDKTKQSRGGYIKTLIGKTGHYSCGNCKISYNAAGECVDWGAKDQHFFEKAAKAGVY